MTAKDIIREREEVQQRESHEIVGLRNQLKMVTFYCRDGVKSSISYSRLLGIEARDNLLKLDFGKSQVVIRGKNLDRIHRAFLDHRVSYIRESLSVVEGGDRIAVIDDILVLSHLVQQMK